MPREFKLPDPGEGIHEAEIIEILVSEGDEVEEGQSVLVIETDKAATEIPSPVTGRVKEIRVRAGDVVQVGDVLMVFLEKGETAEEKKEKADKLPKTEKAAEAPEKTKTQAEGPVPAAPSTRRLARELGVDLRHVTPGGPEGRVTSEDVRAYAVGSAKKPETHEEKPPVGEAPSAPAPFVKTPPLPDFSQWGPVEKVPLRSVRRATAKHMTLAWSQIPHVTHQDEADITDLEAFRRRHKAEIQARGGALTLIPFVLKAAIAALKAHPRFNASLDTDAEQIILKRYYHIGVAVDTDRGLIVPVVRDADRKSISELAEELSELAERTRRGKTDRENMTGGTFTVTNIGSLGGTGFTPLINYPQVAILGMGRAKLQPIVHETGNETEIVPRLILPLILGFDHRVVDGGDAARFLGVMIEILENPEKLMMVM